MANRDGSEVASGSNAAINSSGIFTSEGKNFLSTVSTGDLVFIYHSSATGAWINTVGIFSVDSVNSDTQLRLSNFNKDAHSIPEMTYKIWRPVTYTSRSDWGNGDAILSGKDDSGNPTWYYMVGTFANYIRFSQLKFQDTKYPNGYPGTSCTNAGMGALHGWSANKKGIIIDNCKFERTWRICPTSYTGYILIINNTANDVGAIGFEGGGSYGLFEDNLIENSGGGVRWTGSYAVIRGNRLINLAKSASVICSFHSDGIMSFGGVSHTWIINNYLFNTLEGIYLTYTAGGTSYFTIVNNVIIGNYGAPGGSGDFAIFANQAPNTRIYNNMIFGVPGTQGWLKAIGIGACGGGYGSPNCEVRNNLIYIPNGTVAYMGTCDVNSSVGFLSDYNAVYIPNKDRGKEFLLSGVEKDFSEWKASGYDMHGANSTPQLTDIYGNAYADFDLRLASTDTIARDKGTTGLLPFDINNILRPQGSAWDIGAYEYTGTPQICSSIGGYCCPSGYTCSQPAVGSGCTGTCCISAIYCTQSCIPSWTCTAWGSCAGGLQTRTCTDSNNCGTSEGKPAESQACSTGGLSIGSRVQVITSPSLRVRSSPGLGDATVLGNQPYGMNGTIIGGPAYMDNYTWWQIDYDSDPDGWSIERIGTDAFLAALACVHKSDSDCNGCVSSTELSAFISLWYLDSSSPTLKELIEAIGLWKMGC